MSYCGKYYLYTIVFYRKLLSLLLELLNSFFLLRCVFLWFIIRSGLFELSSGNFRVLEYLLWTMFTDSVNIKWRLINITAVYCLLSQWHNDFRNKSNFFYFTVCNSNNAGNSSCIYIQTLYKSNTQKQWKNFTFHNQTSLLYAYFYLFFFFFQLTLFQSYYLLCFVISTSSLLFWAYLWWDIWLNFFLQLQSNFCFDPMLIHIDFISLNRLLSETWNNKIEI